MSVEIARKLKETLSYLEEVQERVDDIMKDWQTYIRYINDLLDKIHSRSTRSLGPFQKGKVTIGSRYIYYGNDYFGTFSEAELVLVFIRHIDEIAAAVDEFCDEVRRVNGGCLEELNRLKAAIELVVTALRLGVEVK